LANFPVRSLGGVGIISDINPYDLPPNVFSAGVNVRFENGVVSRGPVPLKVSDLTASISSTFAPGHLFTLPQITTGVDTLVAVQKTYQKIYTIVGSTFVDATPAGMSGASDTGEPFTSTSLGGVAYVNRKSHVPFQKTSGASTFSALANWDSTWRCGVLRAYKDFLVALNVSKGGVEYPTMVKWSDLTGYGAPPGSWDATSTTNSAGENILNQMRGRLIDGQVLRDTFMLYSENEVWAMSYIGGNFLFDFRKRFDDFGIINTNCVVEIDGAHYVFTTNDIIRHDGTTKESIVHGRNKDYVFRNLNPDRKSLCFVHHNPKLNEIHFCYPSRDRLVGFTETANGCNRAAVYNYRRDTWTFYDLPNVSSATYAGVSSGLTYTSSELSSYDAMGGTYASTGTTSDRFQLYASVADSTQGITAHRIVGLDVLVGSTLPRPLVSELIRPAFAERVGIDMDEEGAEISSYKSLLKVYPQVSVSGGPTDTVSFQFGANDVSGVQPTWSDVATFSPNTSYQVSVRTAGRYLAHRIWRYGTSDFAYSGFDSTITKRGRQ
jgi:hypothetical protein